MSKNLFFALSVLIIFSTPGCGKNYGPEISPLLDEYQKDPNSPAKLEEVIDIFLDYGMYADAKKYLKKYKKLKEEDEHKFQYIGSYGEKTHDFDTAQNYYEKGKDKFLSNYLLARLYYRKGDMESSLAILKELLARENLEKAVRIKALNLGGHILKLKRKEGKGLQWLNKALQLEPKNEDTILNLASLYLNMQDLNKAKHYYEMVLAENPEHYLANLRMGLLYYALGDNKKARDYYAAAAKKDSSVWNMVRLLEVKNLHDTHGVAHPALVKGKEKYWWLKKGRLTCFVVIESIGLQRAEQVKVYVRAYDFDNKVLGQTLEILKPPYSNLTPGKFYHFTAKLAVNDKVKKVEISPSWNTGSSRFVYR